jgi:hypothetical protein
VDSIECAAIHIDKINSISLHNYFYKDIVKEIMGNVNLVESLDEEIRIFNIDQAKALV